jgi:hypothetical protein
MMRMDQHDHTNVALVPDAQLNAIATPEQSAAAEGLAASLRLLATGLRRCLARQHGWNESVNPGERGLGVASGDQTRISSNAPQPGAPEDTV